MINNNLPGMLWFDNDKGKTLEQVVKEAAEFYRSKYQLDPVFCHVNPEHFPREANETDKYYLCDLELISDRSIIIDHVWIVPKCENPL